jgi:hypothetical protein
LVDDVPSNNKMSPLIYCIDGNIGTGFGVTNTESYWENPIYFIFRGKYGASDSILHSGEQHVNISGHFCSLQDSDSYTGVVVEDYSHPFISVSNLEQAFGPGLSFKVNSDSVEIYKKMNEIEYSIEGMMRVGDVIDKVKETVNTYWPRIPDAEKLHLCVNSAWGCMLYYLTKHEPIREHMQTLRDEDAEEPNELVPYCLECHKHPFVELFFNGMDLHKERCSYVDDCFAACGCFPNCEHDFYSDVESSDEE